MNEPVIPNISNRIFLIRSQKVMRDEDLAKIYGVSTKRLNQQVQRNKERFPIDFMFQLTSDEVESLRLHFATLDKKGRGRYRKYLPYAFTEHGAVMVSAILKTPIAVQASIHIARAFIQLRRLLGSHKELEHNLQALEKRYDTQFLTIFDAIRELKRQTSAHRKLSPPIRGFIND